ncbi:MAG: UPF0182 family protein [Deltaproteobacteria bacterium]
MYFLLFCLLLGSGALLAVSGRRHHRKGRILAGAAVVVAALGFFPFLDFWGEMLWFSSLGFTERFWTVVLAQTGGMLGGGLIGFVLVGLLTGPLAGQGRGPIRKAVVLAGAILGGYQGLVHWDTILQYIHRLPTNVSDPVFHLDTGFYLFALPLYDALFSLLLELTLLGMLATFLLSAFRISLLDNRLRFARHHPSRLLPPGQGGHLAYSFGWLLLVLAGGLLLQRYRLMYSTYGVVSGPGWTDVHLRLPGFTFLMLLFIAAGLVVFLLPRLRVDLRGRRIYGLPAIASLVLALVALSVLALYVIPALCQWLLVEPNEITFEEPYIANNIRFTRLGFGLDRVEEREFAASGALTEQTVEENRNLFANIRLWDKGALDAVYRQFQEIRLYYEFPGVDIDRYHYHGQYRQVMISAREMQPKNLPRQSRTFVNLRFKYTHGYGITLANVSEFTPEGLPDLLIKDIPPQSKYPELTVNQPQIYYGELTDTPVVVNSSEAEFDYPRGEDNVFTHYKGKGGVQLANLWRKFLFGAKFDGTVFFFSSYPRPTSRILFHRQIRERVETIAPFLRFDTDPYIVLAENGRLFWIIDGYTTSADFPYSEPFYSQENIEYRNGSGKNVLSSQVNLHLHGVNYIRNSVKAVVDAYEGTVSFYVFAPQDPLIRVWREIFPHLFKDRREMPPSLARHIRYPSDLLLVQGLVYAKYHMIDPRVFYNQEDLWVRATEKYYSRIRPLSPYYVIWVQPGSDQPQFVLMMPFTPKNRQVMIGWIAGMCDGDNYGRFLVYQFPKEKRILGPQQVETKIDQDPFLSGQLTLWDQRGSTVIRGNVLAIPIEKTLLYVEPIYLQAETAAYPELRLVVLMHNDHMVYAPTFAEALRKLVGQVPVGQEAALPASQPLKTELQKAQDALADYLKQMGAGNFEAAAKALNTLRQTLSASPGSKNGAP